MCISFFFVITHRSTVLSILISYLINKYNSFTFAPNMPCMLIVFMFSHPALSFYLADTLILGVDPR